jgi:hypothetical protein
VELPCVDLLLHPLPLSSSTLGWTGAGASPRPGRLLRRQPLTHLSDGPQYGLRQLFPSASTQGWRVAYGTNTRWSRHRGIPARAGAPRGPGPGPP